MIGIRGGKRSGLGWSCRSGPRSLANISSMVSRAPGALGTYGAVDPWPSKICVANEAKLDLKRFGRVADLWG